MRGTRWLLLLAIAAVLGGVAVTYKAQRKALQKEAPPQPAALSLDLNSSAENWHWTQTEGNRTAVEITAKDFRQIKEDSRVELRQVELKSFHKDGDAYDLVRSAAATFNAVDRRLYSDGEVEITLGVPMQGAAKRTPISIKTSGVTFDSTTGRAGTERASSFIFENGDGSSVGASYDPASRELRMTSQVQVNWKSGGPGAPPMKIEAGSLTYFETKSEIWLVPWGRLTRAAATVEGEHAVIHLTDGAIHEVEATRARGSDAYPGRRLKYAAGDLRVEFDAEGAVRKVTGDTDATLTSTSETAETAVRADRVEMNFEPLDGESALATVVCAGRGVVESKPIAGPGRQLSENRVLRSEVIGMKMRPGGREIESVVTRAPGSLEFVPNLPAQRHRTLDGDGLTIAYGAGNQIESFHASAVKTRTDPTPEERQRNRPPALTASRELLARFDPRTGRMARMEQSGDFTYQEGERRARSNKATLDEGSDQIDLEEAARVWDSTGSTSADRIHLDQRTGVFTAEGRVNSSRQPDRRSKPGSEMLSGDEPLQAQARRMDSSNRNRLIHYQGDVVMWQGPNRIEADAVDVDREKGALTAAGSVVTQFWEDPQEKPGAAPRNPKPAPVLTVIHAPRLRYTDQDRIAVYTGGVTLARPGLGVKSRELRAYLAEAGSGSRLDKAIADGAVEIVQSAADRTRTGAAEHSEYYTAEQKVILRGGRPQLVDSAKGSTRGDELTYFANDDRLLVNGAPDRPATSRLRRK